jgi:DNA-binding MarR family transcriptional regulator
LRIGRACVQRICEVYQNRHREEQVIKTISLSDSDLDALRQVLGQLLVNPATVTTNTPPAAANSENQVDPVRLVNLARSILLARRRRNKVFNKAMFGEPAWDMLLTLYADMAEGPHHSVSRLSALSGAPPTTALRWLDYLEKERLVIREANPTDRRSDFVELTDKGRATMERYLCETLNSAE